MMMPCVTFPFISFNFILMVGQKYSLRLRFTSLSSKLPGMKLNPIKQIKIHKQIHYLHISESAYISEANELDTNAKYGNESLCMKIELVDFHEFFHSGNDEPASIFNSKHFISNPSHFESISFLNHHICNPFHF